MGFAADDRLLVLNFGSGIVWLRKPIHFVKLVLWFPLILLLMLLCPMLLVFGSLMMMKLETSDFIRLEYFFCKCSFSRYLLYFAGFFFKFCLHLKFSNSFCLLFCLRHRFTIFLAYFCIGQSTVLSSSRS